MATVHADPFLKLVISFVDLVLESGDLQILGLDFF